MRSPPIEYFKKLISDRLGELKIATVDEPTVQIVIYHLGEFSKMGVTEEALRTEMRKILIKQSWSGKAILNLEAM